MKKTDSTERTPAYFMPLLPFRSALAILAVVDIAIHEKDRPVRAIDIAERNRLAPRYLEPVLQALVQGGLLVGFRGNHGGYRIARKKSTINVEDIVRATVKIELNEYRAVAESMTIVRVEEAIVDVLASINVEQLTQSAQKLLSGRPPEDEPVSV